MNIIKKYWESAYKYILLIVPGMCMCAGTYWTVCKFMGLYPSLKWYQIIIFDCTQLIYLSIALFFICQNRKNTSYISEHLSLVKAFITVSLFVQYKSNILAKLAFAKGCTSLERKKLNRFGTTVIVPL